MFLVSTLLNRSIGCLAMEVGLGQNNGLDQPCETSNFKFGGPRGLVYAEAGAL